MKAETKEKEQLVCTYKGRKYILLFKGKTRTGRDGAFLMFFDGTRKFWTDLSEISEIEPKRNGKDAASPKEKADQRSYNMYISENEIAALIEAINSKAAILGKASVKKTSLGKAALEKLGMLLKLKEKLTKL